MKETLEEAEKEFEKLINGKGLPTKQLLEVAEQYFIVGYKIAQERSYSEEEVIDLLYKRSIYQDHFESDEEVREWFNKFKKK